MMISTRGRYALRVMTDLAEHGGERISLKEIAQRQEISEKYLESIISLLVKAGLTEGSRGRSGGYTLTRAPENYSLAEILRLTEGTLAPVSCIENGACTCSRADKCPTLPVWENLGKLIDDYLSGVTLRDIMKKTEG